MRAREADIVVIDFESTGVCQDLPDQPWQVGLVRLRAGRLEPLEAFSSLVRVGDRPFNPGAPGQHHRLRAELAVAPTLGDLWPTLKRWLGGRPLAAHNAATEKKLLRQFAPADRFGPWIDTLKIVRCLHPDWTSHRLEDVCAVLGLDDRARALAPGLAPHDALYDAVAAAVLLEWLLAQEGFSEVAVDTLARATPDRFHRR